MKILLGVLAYLIIGIVVARIANGVAHNGIPDPFAFGVVVFWPVFAVVFGLGWLVRLGGF